ncbi:MAG: 4Fe-4S binding protein [Deltaproteobacteria bacterium]|nr:4Fe-4S binding protein [Deltaproteobacteria bacterium]
MKELVIISGKGGTGKTSMVSAIASLAQNKVLCDADVDAADLHLIMAPEVIKSESFSGGSEAKIEKDKCTGCGLCLRLCRYEAISKDFTVDPIECEGCGVCYYFCPEKAILFEQKINGEWFISETRHGPMVHARLGIAEENSGKLVTLVRKEAKRLAEEKGMELIITDGAPGVGCPVIASIGGASAVLIVTEPTVSGVHDMKRVAELASFFKVPAMVCVNKYDLNKEKTEEIKAFTKAHGDSYVGEIPFDPVFTRAMVAAKNIFEYAPDSDVCAEVANIWKRVSAQLGAEQVI